MRVTDKAGLHGHATFDVSIVGTPNVFLANGAAARFIPAKATGSRNVELVLTPPAGATAVRVSNDEDPNASDIQRTPLRGPQPVRIRWTLDKQTSAGKETKLVYVWFERGTDLVHAIPSIVLDEIAPIVTAKLTRRPRVRVKITAKDSRGTGIKKIRIGRKCSGEFKRIGRRRTSRTGR